MEKLKQFEGHFLWPEKNKKSRKFKVSVLVNFLGTFYKGFQIQSNLSPDTVEGNLQIAFFKAGAIHYRNNERITKINWKRISRTDKGVHSSGSIISLKIQNPFDSLSELKEEINKFLPLDIRVMAISKSSKKFDCYQCCSSRTYAYLFPSKILFQSFTRENCSLEDDLKVKVCNKNDLKVLSGILKEFEGSRYYHNFTSRSRFKNKSFMTFQRFITSFRVAGAFVYKGREFVRLEVTGQSFIYNQIRKMVGFSILEFRRRLKIDKGEDVNMRDLFDANSTYNVACAPALGLFLKSASFHDKTDRKEKPFDLEMGESCETFIAQQIIPEICEKTMNENAFEEWLTEWLKKTFQIGLDREKNGSDH